LGPEHLGTRWPQYTESLSAALISATISIYKILAITHYHAKKLCYGSFQTMSANFVTALLISHTELSPGDCQIQPWVLIKRRHTMTLRGPQPSATSRLFGAFPPDANRKSFSEENDMTNIGFLVVASSLLGLQPNSQNLLYTPAPPRNMEAASKYASASQHRDVRRQLKNKTMAITQPRAHR
jgi:hypothetical protein